MNNWSQLQVGDRLISKEDVYLKPHQAWYGCDSYIENRRFTAGKTYKIFRVRHKANVVFSLDDGHFINGLNSYQGRCFSIEKPKGCEKHWWAASSKYLKNLAASLLAIVTSLAHAYDHRIRTEIYDKATVYNVHTQIGRATLIQLEDDESLAISPSTILGIGDADAWDLGVRGNNIALKPTKKMPQTNVVVVTNKRTYSFELLAAAKDSIPTYILRFRYLDSEAAKAAAEVIAEAKRVQITAAAKAEKTSINTDYVWRGDNELLKPTSAYDDGRFTRLVYDHAGEMPVFFKVLADGTEALVNSNIDPAQKNTVVLHEVIRTVRARLGEQVIEIINRSYTLPKFNQNGTGTPGAVRIDRGQPL